MTRPTRKADPRIERIVRAELKALEKFPAAYAMCAKTLRRRLRALVQRELREAADRAHAALIAMPGGIYFEHERSTAVRAAIENRRKP